MVLTAIGDHIRFVGWRLLAAGRRCLLAAGHLGDAKLYVIGQFGVVAFALHQVERLHWRHGRRRHGHRRRRRRRRRGGCCFSGIGGAITDRRWRTLVAVLVVIAMMRMVRAAVAAAVLAAAAVRLSCCRACGTGDDAGAGTAAFDCFEMFKVVNATANGRRADGGRSHGGRIDAGLHRRRRMADYVVVVRV